MSKWNRVGRASMDFKETRRGFLDVPTWLWLKSAINDVFQLRPREIFDPIGDVQLFIRDGNEIIPVMDIEVQDNHHNNGEITRQVIIRPNKKMKRRKYVG